MSWTCEVCGRTFTRKDQNHACASHSLETNFAGWRAKWLPLYQKLLERAKAELPDFTEFYPAAGVMWRHTSTFAEIKSKPDAMEVVFYSQQLRADRNPIRHLQTSANRVVHVVEAVDETPFDDFLRWIKESYALTFAKSSREMDSQPEPLPEGLD